MAAWLVLGPVTGAFARENAAPAEGAASGPGRIAVVRLDPPPAPGTPAVSVSRAAQAGPLETLDAGPVAPARVVVPSRPVAPTVRSNHPLPPPIPAEDIQRVVPLGGSSSPMFVQPPPHVLQFPRDNSGMLPDRPPGPPRPRSNDEIAEDVDNMIEMIEEPDAEISLVEGQSRILQSKRDLTRVVIANPLVADIELLTDQPGGSRLLNVQGKTSGTTSLTLWDETNRPLSFRVRVSVDTKDLESRIRQAFPGSLIKVRQVGLQIILEGQTTDSKTMSDILEVVRMTLMSTSIMRMGMGGMGGGGMGGGGMGGGGMGGGGMGGGGMGGGGMGGGRGLMIVNRVTVPGPRQIMLHVKIAEINRSATRDVGVSWLRGRGQSIIGSVVGNNATFNTFANATTGRALQSVNGALVSVPSNTVGGASVAAPAGTSPLFGVFDSGRFSLFVDALRSNSLAKILAEPNLVALDGQPARFLVGGMFPFPVPQSSSIPGGTAVVTVQFQQFGTILTFLPQLLANDVIRLDVEPVISELNYAQSTTVNGGVVPSITERSTRTVVELREGQTLAIAGLLQLTSNNTTVRIPGLGDLPLVGPWFSADQANAVETETIVLVTPELVAPLEKNEITEAPGDRVFQPNDAEFYLLGRIEGKLGREFRATVAEQDPLNFMRHFQSENHWVVGPHGYAD